MTESITIYCLPYAGTSAAMYLRWRRLLPSWIIVQPIELPGRGSRINEFSKDDYAILTEDLFNEITLALPKRYALFGHSMGALLAHGVAQIIRARGLLLPAALLVSGCPAPSHHDSGRYRNLRDDAALIAELKKQGGTLNEVFENPELLAMTLDLLRVDFRVCGSYRHTQLPPLNMPINAFGGRADRIAAAKLNDWRLEGTQTFTLDWFEGGHFFLRQNEALFLRSLIMRLRESQMEILREKTGTH